MVELLHTGQTGVELGADRAARKLGIRVAGFCSPTFTKRAGSDSTTRRAGSDSSHRFADVADWLRTQIESLSVVRLRVTGPSNTQWHEGEAAGARVVLGLASVLVADDLPIG